MVCLAVLLLLVQIMLIMEPTPVVMEPMAGAGFSEHLYFFTAKSWIDSTEHANVTTLELLTERELKHEKWNTDEEEAEEVWHEEESATPLGAQVWETPEVTQTNGRSNSCDDKCALILPALTVWLVALLVFVLKLVDESHLIL